MSDEGGKAEDDTLKSSGRVRICKHCRFSTTDVREFSKHRLTAHTEEVEEKVSTRRNSLKGSRRASRTSLSVEEPEMNNDGEQTPSSRDLVLKIKFNSNTKEASVKYPAEGEEKNEQKPEPEKTVQPTEQENNLPQDTTATEQAEETKVKPAKEFLDSLNLGAKVAKMNKGDDAEMSQKAQLEKAVLENGGHHHPTDEDVSMNKEDDMDDEGRLVIADDCEDMADPLNTSQGLPGDSHTLKRTGNIQNRTYLCNICEFSTTSAKIYLHHQKDTHRQDILIYECDICEYATKYKQKLPRHRKLHFSGRENNFTSGSDLDNSLSEKEIRELKEMNESKGEAINGMLEGDLYDDDVEEEEEEEEHAPVLTPAIVTATAAEVSAAVPEVVEKKKRIRQEVDPSKYFEVFDDVGIKYACSKCGNVYKWRKSLNKHWKEKHFGETPNLSNPPPTLQNYTLYSRFKNKFGSQLVSSSSMNTIYSTPPSNSSPTSVSLSPMEKSEEVAVTTPVVMPKFIGPFIGGGTNQSLFNSGNASPSLMMMKKEQLEAMERRTPSQERKPTPKSHSGRKSGGQQFSANSQMEPIDFSVKKDSVKLEPAWEEDMENSNFSETSALNDPQVVMNQDPNDPNKQYPVLQCSKCAFVAKTLVDYSAHMTLHLNKRAFKCAECQEHFNGVEDLNQHFAEHHAVKIQEHKEAIQKIPHGLQQTYHLLKMPLDVISNLSSQELLSNEPKQLKCSMCNFIAKWPAELQKHAVSHSEERPFICMVCGSTYKWKWDLVKHFEKSHHTLPNPYKRREQAGIALKPPSESFTGPAVSKTAVALLNADMTKRDYMIHDENAPPKKKRRLSETDMPGDSEGMYVIENSIDEMLADKYEMPKRPSSEPSQAAQNSEDEMHMMEFNGKGKVNYLDKENMEALRLVMLHNQHTPTSVANAIKQHLSGNRSSESDEERRNQFNCENFGDALLPYKCSICEYRARWPSEISQHMKNHSNEKPFHCPRCSYKSKWKWDVVKHLRRCGGGTVNDVIDTSKINKSAPPNVMVMPEGSFQKQMHQSEGLSPSQFLHQQQAMRNNSSLSMSREGTPNFSVAHGGQDHPNTTDFTSKSPLSTTPTSANKQAVFRSLINQGLYHCLECPFIGNSPAELRRHAVLHSENKPFSCDVCGYSSRWKCDLKKHIKTYDHYSATQPDSDDLDADSSEDKIDIDDEDSDEERSTLYMCPKCPYNTYKKQAFDNHLQIHCDASGAENVSMQPTSPAKFKCNKCDYMGNDLSSFLQHKVSHSIPNASGPTTNPISPSTTDSGFQSSEVSNRTLHLKHRRKPVQQFFCPKCPYVCFKRTSLIRHEAMHEPRGGDAFLCLYCDYNVFTRSLLLQHMRMHREYSPGECSDLGAVGESDLQAIEEMEENDMARTENDEKKMMQVEENNNVDEFENVMDSSDSVIDFSRQSTPYGDSRSSTPAQFMQMSTQSISSVDGKKSGGLPCEWCSATFPNLVTLYQHAQTLHPNLLKAQESGEVAPSNKKATDVMNVSTAKNLIRDAFPGAKQFSSSPHSSILQQQMLTGQKKLVPLAPRPTSVTQTSQQSHVFTAVDNGTNQGNKMGNNNSFNSLQSYPQVSLNQSHLSALHLQQQRARKTISPAKRSRSFQCTKCSFTAPNAVTYLRHIERHGSNCKHTCRYCDYSIDRLNLLYQHMKGTHGDLWKGTAEEKINLSVSGEDSNNNVILVPRESPTDSFNASDNSEDMNGSFSSINESNDGEQSLDFSGLKSSSFDGGVLPLMGSKGARPVLVIREDTTWRGIPVQICSLDGKKHYKCPKCYYISSNAANTTNHVRQHGSNRKYRCKQCDYSVDNLKLIQHHMDSVHPKEPNFIQVSAGNSFSIPRTPSAQSYDEQMLDMSSEPTNLSMKTASPSTSMSSKHQEMRNSFEAGSSRKSESIYQCPKCPFIVRNKQVLQTHLERHEYPGKYECQLCDYSVDMYNLLRRHAKLHTRKVRGSAVTLLDDDEELTYEEAAMFEGNSNNKSIDSADRMNMEKFLDTARQGDGRLRYRCSRCPFFTFSRVSLLKHRQQHIVKNRLSCQLCNFSTGKPYLLQQHLRIHEAGNKLSMEEPDQFHDLVLDPLDEKNYRLLLEMEVPEDDDSEDVIEDFEDDENEDLGEDIEDEFYDEMVDIGDDEDDIEAAMMEEELQGHIPAEDLRSERTTVNQEVNFDTEIQFRNYKCPDCPYSSNSASEFRKHCRLHGANLKFQCDYCTYSLDRVNLLSQHRKLHFQEPNFDPSPPTSRLLNKSHEDYDPSKAIPEPSEMEGASKLDESSAENRYSYQKSLPKSPASVTDDKTRYICNKCPYRCNALKSFKCHIQMHGLNRKYKCDYCNWSADRLNLLYQHRKVHVTEPDFIPNPGDIVFLNRKFALDGDKGNYQGSGFVGMALADYPESPFASEELQAYQSTEGRVGPKKFFCKICPYKTDSANEYTYHKKMHCMEARYNCSVCSYVAYSWKSLNEHMKSHKKDASTVILLDNKTRHKCTKCPYSSPNKNLLAVHTTMHAANKKYTCRYCDYSIDRYNLLRQHMKIHMEVGEGGDSPSSESMDIDLLVKKPSDVIGPQLYFSPVKGLELNDSDSYESNSEEFNCDWCPFSTSCKNELVGHEMKHNASDKHACLYCTFNCAKEDELIKHTQLHFPSATVDKDFLKNLKDVQPHGHRGGSHRRNIAKNFATSEKITKKPAEDEAGEPDSTVSEAVKTDAAETTEESVKVKDDEKKDDAQPSAKTKIYVCQYCEREFEGKAQMILHEKQHLVGGYQY